MTSATRAAVPGDPLGTIRSLLAAATGDTLLRDDARFAVVRRERLGIRLA